MTTTTTRIAIIASILSIGGCYTQAGNCNCGGFLAFNVGECAAECDPPAGDDEAGDDEAGDEGGDESETCSPHGVAGLGWCTSKDAPGCLEELLTIPTDGGKDPIRTEPFTDGADLNTNSELSSDGSDSLCLIDRAAYAATFGESVASAIEYPLRRPIRFNRILPNFDTYMDGFNVEVCFDASKRHPIVFPYGWSFVESGPGTSTELRPELRLLNPLCPAGSGPVKMQDMPKGLWCSGPLGTGLAGQGCTALCDHNSDCDSWDGLTTGEGLCTGEPWLMIQGIWGFHQEDHGCEWWPDGFSGGAHPDADHDLGITLGSAGEVVVPIGALQWVLDRPWRGASGLAASVALDGSLVIDGCDVGHPCHALGLRDGDVIERLAPYVDENGLRAGDALPADAERLRVEALAGSTSIDVVDEAGTPRTIRIHVQ